MCYYEGLEFNQAATTLPGVRKRYVKEGVRGSWAILLHHGLSSLTTGRALGGPLESGCAVRWDGCPWTALGSRTELFLEAAVCRGVQLCFALPAPLFLAESCPFTCSQSLTLFFFLFPLVLFFVGPQSMTSSSLKTGTKDRQTGGSIRNARSCIWRGYYG